MGLGSIFGGVGRAFAGIGRWAEKERMALHYGSDWQTRLAKEQEWLDAYWQKKQQADEDNRFRQQAEDEYKREERRETKQKRDLERTNDLLDIVKKVRRGGGDPMQLDPAITADLPFPLEGIISIGDQEIGAEDAERQAKAEKEALLMEQLRASIEASRASTARSNRPDKDVRETGQMTWDQALDNARQFAEAEIPATEVDRAPTLDRIREIANDIMEQYGGLARGKQRPRSPMTEDVLGSLDVPVGGSAVPPGLAVQPKTKAAAPPDPNAKTKPPIPGYVRAYDPVRGWGWARPK